MTLAKITTVLLLTVSVSAFAKESDLEKKILKDLIQHSQKSVKNNCEIGSSPKIKISDFLTEYVAWTFTSQNQGTRSLKCEPLEPTKNLKKCHFRYQEKTVPGGHPGIDMFLGFKYGKEGIDWGSVECFSVP